MQLTSTTAQHSMEHEMSTYHYDLPHGAGLIMSDYGMKKKESLTLAVNARETMGDLFLANPCPMSAEECASIFEKSYR